MLRKLQVLYDRKDLVFLVFLIIATRKQANKYQQQNKIFLTEVKVILTSPHAVQDMKWTSLVFFLPLKSRLHVQPICQILEGEPKESVKC